MNKTKKYKNVINKYSLFKYIDIIHNKNLNVIKPIKIKLDKYGIRQSKKIFIENINMLWENKKYKRYLKNIFQEQLF